MTPRIHIDAIPLDSSQQQLMEKLFVSTHTRLPVYENDLDHIAGVIHLKDVVHQALEGTEFDLRAMLHEVPFVPESMAANELLQQFKQQHVQLAIVIDEYGGTAGLVTFEDLIEEITGEIRDEFDTGETPPLTLVAPGHLRLHGTVRLDEISDYVALDDAFPEVESVGGLVLHLMNAPPRVGDEVRAGAAHLRVEAVQGLTIETVSLLFPADSNETPHPES
jgi:CBS domain containing-hemolysin-like protein